MDIGLWNIVIRVGVFILLPAGVIYFLWARKTKKATDKNFQDIRDRTAYTPPPKPLGRIPEGAAIVTGDEFEGYKDLASVTIPKGVIKIRSGAFSGFSALTSIDIPDSVIEIGGAAFSDCASLASINVGSDNEEYTSIDGVLFNKDRTTLLQYPAGKTDTCYTIPDGVTEIESGAFSGCENLTSVIIPNSITVISFGAFDGFTGLASVTIPDSVTEIGSYAFENCTGLTSVIIPNSVGTIGEEAFYGCKNLTSVIIPNSVETIGNDAFYGCAGLTSVTIPGSVKTIQLRTFEDCAALTSITVQNTKPPKTDGAVFDGVDMNNAGLYVPANSVDAYRRAKVWKDFKYIRGA